MELTLNRSKSNAKKLFLQLSIREISGVPNTRFVIPGMLLYRCRSKHCNILTHPLGQFKDKAYIPIQRFPAWP